MASRENTAGLGNVIDLGAARDVRRRRAAALAWTKSIEINPFGLTMMASCAIWAGFFFSLYLVWKHVIQ